MAAPGIATYPSADLITGATGAGQSAPLAVAAATAIRPSPAPLIAPSSLTQGPPPNAHSHARRAKLPPPAANIGGAVFTRRISSRPSCDPKVIHVVTDDPSTESGVDE